MSASRKLFGIASSLLFVSLAQAGLAAEPKTHATGQMLAMDEMKPMQPGPMGQKSMMMDDKMKAPPSTPMQDQGKMGQPGAQGGMMMMEKMMGGCMGGMSGMGAATGTTGMASGTTGMATGTADVTERIEGQHLVEARKFLVMDDKTTSADRLARYEGHLTERLEAIKSARAAFVRLYPTLGDAQKQTADAILLPLIATF